MNKKIIEDFYGHLKENMLPDDVNQEACGHGKDRWTADMWTVEICRCFIEGYDSFKEEIEEQYRESPGHMNNQIIASCKNKESMLDNIEKIKDDADCICVCEVGRGLDILISNTVKKWNKIMCYDHNGAYDDYLKRYFNNIIFHCAPSLVFLSDTENYIKEKTILIMNHSLFRQFDLIKSNKNIVHMIFDGKLLW